MLENHGCHVTSVYGFSLPGRWKSKSALLERKALKRSDSSTPLELAMMNRSHPYSNAKGCCQAIKPSFCFNTGRNQAY